MALEQSIVAALNSKAFLALITATAIWMTKPVRPIWAGLLMLVGSACGGWLLGDIVGAFIFLEYGHVLNPVQAMTAGVIISTWLFPLLAVVLPFVAKRIKKEIEDK